MEEASRFEINIESRKCKSSMTDEKHINEQFSPSPIRNASISDRNFFAGAYNQSTQLSTAANHDRHLATVEGEFIERLPSTPVVNQWISSRDRTQNSSEKITREYFSTRDDDLEVTPWMPKESNALNHGIGRFLKSVPNYH